MPSLEAMESKLASADHHYKTFSTIFRLVLKPQISGLYQPVVWEKQMKTNYQRTSIDVENLPSTDTSCFLIHEVEVSHVNRTLQLDVAIFF